VSIRPSVQNVPGKNGELSPSSYSLHYTHGKAAQSVSKDQVVWLHLRTCLVRLGVEPAELSEIAVDGGLFRVLRGLLPPRLSPKEKREQKWENEWVSKPTLNLSMYKIVFSLFAKSECGIQIIKHIGMETGVFAKMSWKYQILKEKWYWHPKVPPRHPFKNLEKALG